MNDMVLVDGMHRLVEIVFPALILLLVCAIVFFVNFSLCE